MVKSGSDRATKYANKVDPTVASNRITAMKTTMLANQAPMATSIANAQAAVRVILNAYGVSTILTLPFQAFGLQLWSLTNKGFTGATLHNEAAMLLVKWKARLTIDGVLGASSINALKAICASYGEAYA